MEKRSSQVKVVLFIFLLLCIQSCSHKKGESQDNSPGMEAWSCSYVQDIIAELQNQGTYINRNQKYKNFELYDVYVLESNSRAISAPDVGEPYDGDLPSKYKFYPTLKEINYSQEDLAKLGKLADIPSENAEAKNEELKAKNNISDGFDYRRYVYGYNFIDAGSNHCDVEVFHHDRYSPDWEIYKLSDVQESFSLNKLAAQRCKDKVELIPASENSVILKRTSKGCRSITTGYVKTTSYSAIPEIEDERCGTGAEMLTLKFSEDNVDSSVSILDRNLSEVSIYDCTGINLKK